MRYLCVHCDKRFDHEGDKKPRCPECMRVNGLEKIRGDESSDRAKWIVPAVAVGILAATVAGYAWWARETPDTVSGNVALRPLEKSELRGHVRRLHADVPDEWLSLLSADEAVERFAADAVSGADTDVAKAEAVVAAIRARAAKHAFIPWGLSTPRDTPIRAAAAVSATLARDDGRARLYPLEVAALAVAALRSEGVDAMVADIYAFPGDRSPPDPSGHFGYFGVAVYPEGVGKGDPKIFDPYLGHATEPAADDVRVLNDVQVLGAALNHLAIHRLVRDGELAQAFDLSEAAVKLDPQSPSVHSVRGAVLLMSGGGPAGVQEFEAAAQLRPDAPRHNNLAGLALADQPPDLDRASREVAAALALHPDYAAGHATMAAVHLARGETELAESELDRSKRLDPELPILPMLQANLYLATHELDRAGDAAKEAVRRQPNNWQVRLNAARVMRVAGLYDDMRVQARQIMQLVPESQRGAVEQLIGQVLGPTALEAPIEDEEADEESAADEGAAGEGQEAGDDFQLGGPGLLGGSNGRPFGGSLLGDGERLGGGALPNPGEPSKLRLGTSGGRGLRLDLNE